MRSRLTDLLLATDLADLLVETGAAFRDAHHLVGVLVAEAVRAGTGLLDLPDSAWTAVPGGTSLREKLTFERSLERRDIEGGTGPTSVARQLESASERLESAAAIQAAMDKGGF
jgi:argininosuccinate lyase